MFLDKIHLKLCIATKVPQKPPFWDKFDGYSLWTAITWTPKTWILFLLWDHSPLPGLGNKHWKCSKSPFLDRTMRESCHTKWYFRSFFDETVSLFWFSLFLLQLTGFWLISFKLHWCALVTGDKTLLDEWNFEDILEYRDGDGWKKVGAMKNERNYHGISVIKYEDFKDYCN